MAHGHQNTRKNGGNPSQTPILSISFGWTKSWASCTSPAKFYRLKVETKTFVLLLLLDLSLLLDHVPCRVGDSFNVWHIGGILVLQINRRISKVLWLLSVKLWAFRWLGTLWHRLLLAIGANFSTLQASQESRCHWLNKVHASHVIFKIACSRLLNAIDSPPCFLRDSQTFWLAGSLEPCAPFTHLLKNM